MLADSTRYRDNPYGGTLDRAALLDALGRAAERVGIRKRDVRVRGLEGSEVGVHLTLAIGDREVVRTCESQPSRLANLGALVGWATDLARSSERGIETLGEALHGDGVALALAGVAASSPVVAHNAYDGDMAAAEAWALVRRSLTRLGLDDRQAWLGPEGRRGATLRFALGDGQIVEKRSAQQRCGRRNAAVLALWLRTKALHHERGIERDLARTLSAYLLGSGR